MKSALKKDFFREIRRNSGRFISILFIVLLGAAFYAGIRSANYDMKYSADHYYDQTRLMDIRVVSTLGLTEADLEDMRQVEGVESVVGGYTQDVLCENGDAENVLQMIALTEGVNQVTLTEGRMPENARECVVDTAAITELGYEIGDTITVQSGTEDDLSDSLRYDTYTIVGSGSIPYYLDLTRGSSSIGHGTQDAFVLVEADAFSLDVYTEAYVQVEGAREAFSYSDAYEDLVDPVRERLEEIADAACQRRYEEVRQDAEAELSDARAQLSDAETELSDAAQEIADGWAELSDAEQLLRAREQELHAGEAELSGGEQELSDARAQLAEGEAQYRDGEAALHENQALLDATRAQLEEGKTVLEAGEAELSRSAAELESARTRYEEGLAQYEQGQAAYEEQRARYEAGLQAYEQGAEEYAAREEEFRAGWDAFVSTVGEPREVVRQFEELDARKTQMEEELAAAGTDPADSPEYQQLLVQWNLLKTAADTAQQLLDGQAELAAAGTQLEETRAQLAAAEPVLEAAAAELESSRAQLADAEAQITAGEAELAAGQQELAARRAQLSDAETQLAAGEAELAAGWQELTARQPELEEARAQIAEGEAELEEARAQIEEGRSQIQEGWQQIEENRRTLTDAEAEYENARQEAEQELADARVQIADGEEALAQLEVPDWYVLDRSMISSVASFEQDAERMKNLGEVFPVFFFLVAALVSLTAMTRMVEEQRIQIGTLKALGYRDSVIALKYFSYAMLATVTGAVLGIWIGEKALPYIIMDAYGMMYTGFSEYFTPINWDQGALALAASAASTGIATLVACIRELRAKPAELMRPEAPKNGKRILLERIRFIWKHLSFNRKSTFRNLFRYKKRFFMTIIGIGGCMALMLVGFGLQDSITAMAQRQYVDIFTYDAAVNLDSNAAAGERRELVEAAESYEGVTAVMELSLESVELQNGENTMDAYLYVPEDTAMTADFLTLKDRVSQETYTYPEEGAALSEKTARMLGVSAGDTVTVDMDGKTAEIPVTEIVENYVMHYMFISPAQYEASFGEEPVYNQLEINYRDNSPAAEQRLGNAMMEYGACTGISFVTELEQEIQDMLRSLNIVIYVLILSAGLLAFVVLYNLNSINITERRRELATLKVLGFYDMEVAMYVYRENIILTLIGILAGAFMGMVLHRFTIQTVEVDMMMFGRQIGFFSYLLSGIITVIFSVLVNLVMYRNLKKIDMIESLKSVE